MKNKPVLFIMTCLVWLVISAPPQKGHVLVCQARSCKPVTDSNLQNNFSAEEFELVPVLLN